jgi:hypothetical protein
MTAYGLDVPVTPPSGPAEGRPEAKHGAPPLPDAPPDDTNL